MSVSVASKTAASIVWIRNNPRYSLVMTAGVFHILDKAEELMEQLQKQESKL